MSEGVKVLVRIRPGECEACVRPAVGCGAAELTYVDGSTKEYPVETVLGQKATQSDVYAEIGPATVDKVLTGYNACILAYGQTGSGKTHTMLGTPEDPGIVFRVLKVLMERAGVGNEAKGARGEPLPNQEPKPDEPSPTAAAKQPSGDSSESVPRVVEEPSEDPVVVYASAYQVYNEVIYDLLQKDNPKKEPKKSIPGRDDADSDKKGTQDLKKKNKVGLKILRVREVSKGCFAVPDARRWRLRPNTVAPFVALANERRYLARTLNNAASSRSHMVFQVDVTQRFEEGLSELQSTLLLVDLAGSENASALCAMPSPYPLFSPRQPKKDPRETLLERMRESSCINKSLSTLRLVMENLADTKGKPLSFRDSQLTKLLKECFGGNALTTLICNVSPTFQDVMETRNTLEFSQTSRKVVNTVQKNVRRSYDDLLREMHRLQELLLDVSCDIKTLQRKLPSDVSAERVTNGTNAKGIPYAFICPLIASNAEERVMDSPVVAADGITYEEQAVLAKWRQEQRLLGPIRVGHHSDLVYFPEKALQAEIDEWVMDKLWPADVLKTIFSFLPCAELVSCSLVCRTWTPPARDDDVWLPHFSNFGTVSEVLQGRKAHKSWAAYHTHTFPNFDQSDGKSALFRGRRSHILYGVSLLSFKEAQRSCEG